MSENERDRQNSWNELLSINEPCKQVASSKVLNKYNPKITIQKHGFGILKVFIN